MDAALRAEIEGVLGARLVHAEPVAGGDINQAVRARLADGRVVFVKHHELAPPGMFDGEAHGLGWLAAAGALRVPRVLGHGARWLALEWLEPGQRVADFDARLGRGLAQLHRAGAPGFGLDRANFLATLPQDNRAAADWPTFWLERRLRPTAELAIARGRGPARWRADLDRLAAVLPAIAGPAEPPARLHGDLWTGNVHVDDAGAPVLIDPAVYGGHREVDLAMLALFGTVSPRLIGAYDEVWPLADGWRDRVALWQLYPLLVHAVLFGGGYAAQVQRVLDAHS